MGIFDFLNSKPSVAKLTDKLVNHVFTSIQNEKGVRVEDAICVMATILGERCIKVANEFPLNGHDFKPGSAVFSEKINEILAGTVSTEEWDELSVDSVFRKMKLKLNSNFESNHFPSIREIFESHAQSVGGTEWGNLKLSVPEDNLPFILPLHAGYETRKFVEEKINLVDDQYTLRVVINAMCDVLIQTKKAIDPKVALSLTFEIINGMSKTASMTDDSIDELKTGLEKK